PLCGAFEASALAPLSPARRGAAFALLSQSAIGARPTAAPANAYAGVRGGFGLRLHLRSLLQSSLSRPLRTSASGRAAAGNASKSLWSPHRHGGVRLARAARAGRLEMTGSGSECRFRSWMILATHR